MKKILLMIVAVLMATVSVNAQSGYDDTKHEVAVSGGLMANSQWLEVFVEALVAVVGGHFDNTSFVGPFSAEYFYHIRPWFGVGGDFTFDHSSLDYTTQDGATKTGFSKKNYLTLMPAVKFDWLRREHFGMYTKLAAGASLRLEHVDYVDPDREDTSTQNYLFNWQASLLGIEAGGPRIRGFLELGVGEQGIALVGVRYKF